MENERESRLSSVRKSIVEIAATITALGVIVTFILSTRPTDPKHTADYFQIIVVILNLIALILFCLLTKPVYKLEFRKSRDGGNKFAKDDSARKYWKLLNIDTANDLVKVHGELTNSIEQAQRNEVRVNRLVKQLKKNVYWYAIFLIIVYLAFLLGNELLYLQRMELYQRITPFFKMVQDIGNYLSAAFLYLAFKVLYDRTLDDENDPIPYYNGISIFSVSFLFAYFIFAAPYIYSNTGDFIPNVFRLFVGVFNGITMALLFSRYISMEHTVKRINRIKYDDLITLCTIYILPVYALAQPLFGSFDISAFGDSKVFANCVFFVCFIGKAFFLYFTYLFMKEKLMHIYLHLVITSHGVSPRFEACFNIKRKGVEDIQEIGAIDDGQETGLIEYEKNEVSIEGTEKEK